MVEGKKKQKTNRYNKTCEVMQCSQTTTQIYNKGKTFPYPSTNLFKQVRG